MRFRLAMLLVVVGMTTAGARAACTLQLSDEGVVRMQSGEERTLTWNAVPGAASYLVEELIEGLNEPSGPDFTFGGPYTESHNYEGRDMLQFLVKHEVTYKIRFRYTVTALNRDDASFEPCKDDVLYVIEPSATLAEIAARRIVPLAGKGPGANGAQYSTALILAGTGMGTPDQEIKLYQGRIYFRPLGGVAKADDPFIEYALDGDETIVYDDIMKDLGVTGTGTIEIVPRTGWPTPLADAIIENRMADGRSTGVRVAAAWGRDLITRSETVTIGIRNENDTRLSFGVRSLGGPAHVIFQHLKSDGTSVAIENRFIEGEKTFLFPLTELFGPLATGDRIIAHYGSVDLFGAGGRVFPRAAGGLLFVTETGNHFNNPNVVYRESMDGRRYADGFDRFVIY